MSSIAQLGSLSGLSGMSGMGPPAGMKGMQPSAEMRQRFEAKFKSAAEDAGIDISKFSDLKSQIETRVGDALKNADGSTDLQSAIDQAVNGVLEDNGIDPEQFKSQMEQVFRSMGAPAPSGGGYDRSGGLASSTTNSKNDLLSKLLSQLGGDSAGGFFGSQPSGSLVDAAA